jgi:hypothetical protein
VGHSEDIISLLHQVGRQHVAALLRNIDPQLFESPHGVLAGWKTVDGPHACRNYPEITSSFYRMPKQALGHGTATDIACADEKDCLHHPISRLNLVVGGGFVNAKSTRAELLDDGEAF